MQPSIVPSSTPRYAAALRLHATPRVISYALAALMLILTANASLDGRPQYVLAAYASAYPWLAHAWALHNGDDRRTIPRLFAMDGINAGIGGVILGLAPIPSGYLLGVTLGNAVAFGGARAALVAAGWIIAGGMATFVLLGHQQVVIPRSAELIALTGFVVYVLLLGFNTHVVAERLRSASRNLRAQAAALERASLTDPLTGATNRRALYQRLRTVSDAPWALILVDLDHFKRINDQHGHDAGDRVLCETVERLQRIFPPPCQVVRWGGEEFLIVIENECESLDHHLRELLSTIKATPVRIDEQRFITVTCSCGAAVLREWQSWDNALSISDQALYHAKTNGRDQACFASSQGSSPVMITVTAHTVDAYVQVAPNPPSTLPA